ncbi:MAG: hypothetical protein ACHQ50_06510 [Fimbriimonadales bacterium]
MVLPLLAALGIATLPNLRLTTSPFAAQYGYIRAAQEAGERPAGSGLSKAVDDLTALGKSFPSQFTSRSGRVVSVPGSTQAQVDELYWRTIDALVFSIGDPARFAAVPQIIPKIGGALDSETAMKVLARAMDESRLDYERDVSPLGDKAAKAQIAAFESIPEKSRDKAVEFILGTAGISKPPASVDILVIPRMAGKEGMTVRTPAGTRIVIGLGKYAGADFAEVVLHESTHVFDTTAGGESLFGKLRTALTAAKRPAFEIEQVPHVCMFMLAAEAVRRFIDPAHKDVGDTFGAYSRGLGPLRDIVRPDLDKLIAGQPIDQTVANIVCRLHSPRPLAPREHDGSPSTISHQPPSPPHLLRPAQHLTPNTPTPRVQPSAINHHPGFPASYATVNP